MSSEPFEDLYKKYVQNECTDEELVRFLEEIGEEDQTVMEEGRLFQLFDKTWKELDVYPGQFGLPPQVLPEVQQPEQGRVIALRPWKRYIAAAAILMVVAITAFLWVNREKDHDVATVQQVQQDISPGTNRAILTLADGRQVMLDSTTGEVASEGGVTVINLNGKLAYNPSNATEEARYHTISVPRGGQYQLVLADGTKVWLNAASSLRFPNVFAGPERVVELTGEGYFEVANNKAKPFQVQAGTINVHVLGTHFNINSFGDEPMVKTTLLEGSVRVQLARGQSPESPKTSKAVILRPGDQAQFQDIGSSPMIEVVQNVDTESVLAWKNGWFEFDNTDLPAVMRQISRWYNIDVVYKEKPAVEKFGGRINRNLPLSKILEFLEANGIHFELRGRVLTVLP